MTTHEQLERARRFNDWVGKVVRVAGTVALAAMARGIMSWVLSAFEKWVLPLLQRYYGRLAVEIVFIAAGYALFKLKVHMQRLYGSLECAVAVATSWVILENAANGIRPEHIVGLIAAGYILVRGLSNISEGQQRLKRAL